MGIPTKAVKAVISNNQDEILLLQRNPQRHGQSNWDLPGGLIEENEKEEDALVREIKEELAVDIEIIGRGGTWKFIRLKDNKQVDVHNYDCKIIGGEMKLSGEHTGFKWVNKPEIRKYPVKDESFYAAIK